MKRKLTFLLMALLLLTGMTSWGQNRDEVAYTLEPIAGSNNSYTGNCDIEIDGITWNLTGNSQMIPWRIGGKSITEVDRDLYSKTAIAESISQIEIEHGTASGITVNSMTLTVALNSDFTDPVSVMEGEFAASSTTTFVKPEDTDWTNMYYKITYNVTVSGTSNKYIQFVGAVFYTGEGGQPQETVATPTFSPGNGTYFEPQSVTISCTTEDASIYYTIDGTDPDESSSLYTDQLTISETTTLKAKAFKSGYTASGIATATYTFPSIVNISDITAAGTYVVQGTIVAKSTRGFIVGDGTGYIYYYNTSYSQSDYAIGNMVKISGSVVTYGGVYEFNNSAVVTAASTSSYVEEEPTVIIGSEMDERVSSSTPAQLSNYVQYVGTLTVSGTYYNITNIEGATTAKGSISFPIDTDFTSLNGQEVVVKGYYVGISSSQYYNTMIGSVEANVIIEPTLTVTPTELTGFQYTFQAGPSEAQSITVTGSDLMENVTVTATQDFEVSTTSEGTYSNTLSLTPTDGSVSQTLYVRMKAGLSVDSYTGTVSLTCGELSQSVTLSGTVSEQPIAEAPTFSPDGGTFLVGQTVTLSTTTADATIYYTLDETDPTESSAVYSAPIEVNATTTIKAMAVASGYANSAIASATYTINEPISIAEAHALEANEYACVEGVVTFIDGRNVYVQDETAGIVLYLNNNTVPSDLAISNKVRAYGKRATYNGLIELSAINGGDENEFTILSTGNPLPLAIKTIAEINEDFAGSNLLQSTRLKIQEAIIGAINTSGNTPIMQDGNSLNIYHIPTVDGLVEGDIVTVVGILGCYNAPQLRVLSAGDVQYAHRPTISATPTSLSGMTYDYVDGGPSEITSFELSGSTLSGPVMIYPSESFEVSTLGGDMFVSENPTTIFSPIDFSDINIYVRMKANLEPGTYTEQLYGVSEGADTLFVSVSGTVVGEDPTPPTPPTPTEDGYIRISDLNGLVEGSYVVVAARFDENTNDYYAMSNTASGKPTGVLFTSEISGDNEVLPATITDEEDSYYWIVGMTGNGYTFTNANGDVMGYSSGTNFATGGDNTEWSVVLSTAGESAMVPGYEGFYITNVNTPGRGFALNNLYNYGAYAVSNNNNSGYNFYLDLFVKTEGIEPPTPVVATPTFNPEAGTYYEEQTVSIACTTEDATIHYTLDGSDPTEESPVYNAPLTISETTTIKAIAMKEGYDNSAIAEATYTIQLGVVVIFNQDWEGDMNGWTFVDVEGEATWIVNSYQGNHYANANGHNHGANEDWCISPAFNLDVYDNPVLTFRTAMNFTGNDLEVFFSNDYDGEDPTAATWTALTCELSTGGYTWVESGAIDLSSFSGTECYIGFKYTCTEETAAAWEVDDILLVGQTSAPVVTVTPLALTGFTYIEGNGPSAEQSFTISGLNLSEDITITEATDFEISLASGDDFEAQSTITLTPNNGNVEETTVYVRMKADLEVGEYNEESITVACDDVDDIVVTCSGSVTEAPVPGGDYVRISNVGELVAGNRVILAARFDDNADAYRAIANTLSGGKPATTEFTSVMDGDNEIVSADILADESSYYWTISIDGNNFTFTNANGDVIGYGSGTNFNMNGEKTAWTIQSGISDEAALVPDYNGFNITNVDTDTRAFALRFNNDAYTCGAYSTSNLTNVEYNFFLDIFMQGEGGTPTVVAPTFNPAGGTYYEAQEVTITCSTEGATIYYSFESEEGPWTEYEDPILVEEDMTIWAYATMEGYNDSPVVSAEYVIQAGLTIIFNQDWEEDWNGWTEVSVLGDTTNWTIAEHNGNHYAYMNAHNQGENEDWLISPAFDLTTYPDAMLTFVTARNYNGPEIEVFFSNDYDGEDPTTATWVPLTCELSTGSWNWTESGEISLESFEGSSCYIAFKYTSTEDAAAAWEVDDIMLVSGAEPPTPTPTLTATPNTINGLDYMEGEGPSESQSYTLTAANLEGEGNVTVTASEGFEISLDDEEYDTTLEIAFADGELEDQPVTIYVRLAEGLEAGSYEGTISHEGGNATAEVNLTGAVHSENEPAMNAMIPLYIQGNNGTNNNRIPVAMPTRFTNLQPNTTYRYTNQFVVSDDGLETAGAGNVIYVNSEGFYRSTSPSLATEGGYGEFTTGTDGSALVWFMNESTANARFTPGNHVFLRVRLNDGNDGTTVEHIFTSEDYATVLNFGNENDEYSGSAFYVKSAEAPMTFALMYDLEGLRPFYATSIESTGVDYGNINQYADFYKEFVAGNDGWFGGILPNINDNGLPYILIVRMNFTPVREYASEDGGFWYPNANTANPTNGIDDPIFIDLTYDDVEELAEVNVKVWSADHEFVVENGDDAHYTMTVYNMLGQSMMQKQINAGSTQRISHNLSKGLYIIRLQNNQNMVSHKVIVR
jgi:hypothetical protein